jgi:hypothetical protein
MVPGGIANEAAGVNSFAAGQRAKANHDGTFVWGDQISADFTSTGANQFLIRAVGGVGIGRNAPTHQLDVQGGVRIRPQTNTNLLVTGATDDIYIDLIKHTNTVASARIEFEGFTNPGDHEGEIAFFTRTTAGPAMFERMRIKADGTVGIGTTSIDAGTLFEVDGGDIRVTGGDFVDDGTTLNAPDYVFGADYPLLTLAELERHIARYGHLPNVPSADDIQRDGLNLSRFQMVLLEKIEELTLYTLQQQAAIEARDTQIAQLEARLTALEAAAPTR